MKRSFIQIFWVFLCLFLILQGCSKRDNRKEEDPEDQSPPEIVISKENKNLLFSYIDKEGNFKDVQSIDDVPQEYRRQVVVFDLSLPPEKRMAHRIIYLADLREPNSDGRYKYTVASRYEFESNLKEFGQPVMGGDSGSLDKVGVTIYTTSWCSVCAELRKYLRRRGVSFIEKDIEKDPSAQAEMLNKLRLRGMRGSGVPVIDINGEIIVGFNKEILDSKIK